MNGNAMPPEWFQNGLTIIIAAWAAWSAWHQHHVARDKVRLDLFEKRQELFEAVQRVIIAAHDHHGKVDLEDLRRAALRATFLFGSDVSQYLTEDAVTESVSGSSRKLIVASQL
jgi:hypothetical protein